MKLMMSINVSRSLCDSPSSAGVNSADQDSFLWRSSQNELFQKETLESSALETSLLYDSALDTEKVGKWS
jgi:hypothetical protein